MSDLEKRSLDSTGPESAFPNQINDESYYKARLQAAMPAALEAVCAKEEKPNDMQKNINRYNRIKKLENDKIS